MLSSAQIQSVVELLEQRCGLDAAYIFGSEAAGRTRPESDVDVAVLVRRLPAAMERLQLRQDLEDRLRRPVDLIFLEDASPILARQVLRHGRLVFDGEPHRRAEFIVRSMTEYADLKRARAPAEKRLVERMRDAG